VRLFTSEKHCQMHLIIIDDNFSLHRPEICQTF